MHIGSTSPDALAERGEAVRQGLSKLNLLRSLGRSAYANISEAKRQRTEIESERTGAEVQAPEGFIFTVTIKTDRYQISTQGPYDTTRGCETWSALMDCRTLGDYTFVADTLYTGEDMNGIIAPIFARKGGMRLLVNESATVNLIPIADAPKENSRS